MYGDIIAVMDHDRDGKLCRFIDGLGEIRISSIYDLELIGIVMDRPDAEAIFEIIAMQGGYLHSLRDIARSDDAGRLRDAIYLMRRLYPALEIWGYDYKLLDRPSIVECLTSDRGQKIYRRLAALTRGASMGVSDFYTIMCIRSLDEMLADDSFMKSCADAVDMTGSESERTKDLMHCLMLGKKGMEAMASGDNIEALDIVARHMRIDVGQIKHLLKLVERGFLPRLKALESSGLWGEGRLLGGRGDAVEYLALALNGWPSDPSVVRALADLQEAEAFEGVDIIHLPKLVRALELPGAAAHLTALREISGEPLDFIGLEETGLLVPTSIPATEPEFRRFMIGARETLFDGEALSTEDIKEVAKLYRRGAVFQGPEIRRIAELLKREFGFAGFSADMLGPMLDIAQSVDVDEAMALCRSLGIKPESNDLLLLGAIIGSPELRRLTSDRDALIAEVRTVYDSPPLERREKDFSGADYTERPPLDSLDSLALIRLLLLHRSLADPDVLGELGVIASRDIGDKRTEYGGVVRSRGQGVHFEGVDSIAGDDGSYDNDSNEYLHGGLMTFHLHAQEPDMSAYAGPSGDPRSASGGDWDVVRMWRKTGVVVTTAGFTDDSQRELWIDIDMYYVDSGGRPFVVDLGLRAVPYVP